MKGSILGSRALRVACACALALGIAPAAAWGAADDEPPASEVETLQEVVEDMPQEDSAKDIEPKKDEMVSGDLELDDRSTNGQEPIENAEGDEEYVRDDAASFQPATSIAMEPENGDSTLKAQFEEKRLLDNPDASAKSAAGFRTENVGGENPNPSALHSVSVCEYEPPSVRLIDSSINLSAFECPAESQHANTATYHLVEKKIECEIIWPDNTEPEIIMSFTLNLETGDTISLAAESSSTKGRKTHVILSSFPTFSCPAPGLNTSATLDVMVAGGDHAIKSSPVPLRISLADSGPLLSPTPNAYLMHRPSMDLDLDSIFTYTDEAKALEWAHYGIFFSDVHSSDESVIKVIYNSGHIRIAAIKPGNATVTCTTITGQTVSNTVQVIDWDTADLSRLKFKTDHLSLQVGDIITKESLRPIISEKGLDDVRGYYRIAIEDQYSPYLHSRYGLGYPAELNDSGIVAFRPGHAVIQLHYFHLGPSSVGMRPEDTMTDTLGVDILPPEEVLRHVSSASDFQGDLMESNHETNLLIEENNVSVLVKRSAESDLTDKQREAYQLLTPNHGTKKILVDISLVTQDGLAFPGHNIDNQHNFNIRLKLSEALASLDPSTISVLHLNSDGTTASIPHWVSDGYLYFSTPHFSPYAIVGEEAAAENPSNDGNQNNSTGNNSGNANNDSENQNGNTSDNPQGGEQDSGSNNSRNDNIASASDKGASDTVSNKDTSSKNTNTAKASGATRSDAPLAQTGDSLLPLAAALGIAAILGVFGLAAARRRMSRQE